MCQVRQHDNWRQLECLVVFVQSVFGDDPLWFLRPFDAYSYGIGWWVFLLVCGFACVHILAWGLVYWGEEYRDG